MECTRAAPIRIAQRRAALARALPFAIAVASIASTARAEDNAPTPTTAIGTCPSAEQTDAEVLSLIPDERRAVLEGIQIDVEDLGPSYRVTVLVSGEKTERTYSDPRRDCEQRARFAAVFAALTLMPPQLGEREHAPPPPAAPPPPPVVRRAPPPPSPKPEPLVRLEVAAAIDSAAPLPHEARATLVGGELSGALGRGEWAVGLALGYFARSRFDLDGLDGTLERLPGLAFGRWRHSTDHFDFSTDLGAGATVVRAASKGLLVNHIQIHPEPELFARAQLAWNVGSIVSPFIGARVTWAPAAYRIAVAPRGEIGSLPHLWLGGMLGLSLAL
jgi:hypothetical protein